MIVRIRQVEPQFGCDPHVGIVSRGEYLTKCEKLAFFTMGNFSTQYTQIMQWSNRSTHQLALAGI